MQFIEPWYALLILPILAGLIWSWRHIRGIARPRKMAAMILRGVMAGCLVLALMGPQCRRPNEGLAVMFVVDTSDSVSDSEAARANDFVSDAIGQLGTKDVAAVMSFGRRVAMESAPSGRRSIQRPQAETDPSASNLAAALRLASAAMPAGKGRRVVVLSDGNETMGDARQAAEAAGLDGAQIDVVPLGRSDERAEVAVLEATAPSDRKADEPFEIRVLLESSVSQAGTLVLDRNGVVVSRTPVQIPEGKSTVVLPQKIDNPGFYRYRVTLEPTHDSDGRNNIGASFVRVQGKPRVLVLQDDPGRDELARALREQGLVVDVYGVGGVPTRAEELQPYEAVILNDINAISFVEQQMALLEQAVQDSGLGLAMIGGENSFLPGGWYGTPVAEALPVDLNIRQRKSFPSTTVLIVVDASGSMGMQEGNATKIQLAAKAAEQTAQLLSANDRLGVAGSTDGIEYVAKISKLTDKNAVISNIRKLRPGGGGIYAEPSVKFAKKELEAENSKVRHFILLGDGADVDSYGASLDLIREMREQKITTSVVAIGDGPDVPFLKQLAAMGGGRFYLADKAGKLPAIFTQDVAVMGRSAIEEGVFLPKLMQGEEILRGITATPALYAYCLTEPRPLAQVGMISPKEDPLLATWRYGLGRSLAYTSDATNQWAREWVGWDGFSTFWAQAVRSVLRQPVQGNYAVETRQEGGRGVVQLTAKDENGVPITASDMEVRVSSPSGESLTVPLVQEAPGVFTGDFNASEMGSYMVSLIEESKGGDGIYSSGFSVSYPPEYRDYRPNQPLLNELIEAGNGKMLERPEDAVRELEDPGETIQDIWIYFLMAAVLLLPLDVANRRLALPWSAIFASVAGWFRRDEYEEEDAEEETRLGGKDAPAEAPAAAATAAAAKPARAKAKKRKSTPAAKQSQMSNKLLEAKRRRQQDQDDE